MIFSSKSDPYRDSLARLKPAFWGVAGFSAIVNVLMLTGSIYMMQVYDRVLSSGSVPTLVGLFTIVVVLYAFLGLYDFLRVRILARASVHLDQALADQVYRSWLRSGVPGAAGKDASAQPLRDLEALRGFVGASPMAGLFDLPFVPLFLAVLFIIHPWLGFLTIAGSAVVIALTLLNQAMTQGLAQKALQHDSAAQDFAEGGKRGAEAVVAMGMNSAITTRWRGLHDDALAVGQRTSDPNEALTAFSKAFRMLLQSTILTLGAFLVLRGEITAGTIIAASLLSGRALAPVDQVVSQMRGVTKTWAAHKRLGVFFAALPEPTTPIDLPAPTGQITLSGVTKFAPGASGPDQKKLVHQVTFALEPGDGLGVIGNSASGKSTLAKLLVGVWEPDMGELRMGGATRDQWDPAKLGPHIGYMPQSLFLLPGTIRDNIARFQEDASDADVMAAAQMAGVHDMILALPEGYKTRVGGSAGSVQLSGGQVQRVGLARAVFSKPALVVLDEPNANLDTAGDEALTQAIVSLREAGTTVVVMAHRPSAIAAVNKVLVLKDGQQVQCGPKEEVLGKVLAPVPPQPPPRQAASA
ncbi:Type I secretion system ATP-binding protein PrsD (plasmid) [Roseobacter fucihabitans]|uniref:Type I secretion system ATP-binding protein PrsD n=1 Tax=Roseobacter fucihabitans TaxID=1537242 RepID=A0ABZ2C0H1_9RHOB|nr:type I secretion system permease/ATPase [Roseobacter litoralis]MBC6967250.1 Type I secretion system ATP-binding protein PrsD [Roseobacter litoralis]